MAQATPLVNRVNLVNDVGRDLDLATVEVILAQMIASARTLPAREDRFLEMLPQIREQARHAFRNEQPERREDLLAEVIANCWMAFSRLMDCGLDDVSYHTPLVQYAIKQVRDGRRIGSKLNSNDVSSGYAQRRKSFVLKTMDLFDDAKQEWKEVLVEDKHAGSADTAAARIDFDAWLRLLPRCTRRVSETLANGETTKTTAKRCRVSAGRISQLRRELQQRWQDFQGEAVFSYVRRYAACCREPGPTAVDCLRAGAVATGTSRSVRARPCCGSLGRC